MIRLIGTNKIKFILGIILVFLISYILGVDLFIPIYLAVLFAYLKFSYKDLSLQRFKFLNINLLFVMSFVTAYFIIKQGWPVYYIPFCIIPMLTTILFAQLQISLLITLASCIAIASIAGNNLYLGVLFLISGISSSLLVMNIRRRMAIISAGFIVGLLQALTLFFIDRFQIQDSINYIVLILNAIVSSIIVVGILPVFEYLFKTVTNISLLELTDFNHSLLQRLILEAPGTYHHSLVVGNLSESGCRAVGANALLARVGGYYHDIGKLEKPGYFSENYESDKSKHDTLAPTMSKLVIINHVKEGVELARKYKLNPSLIDFIVQHHGTSLVYYFYRRALENLEEHQEIKEEGFRYPGPKPNTKETAVVLLADSVEAATRALKELTPANIQEVVHKIINNKFIDGQLDECDLTLKDLEKISAAFIRILSGIYHSRITYPERTKESENNHKKSPKESLNPSEKDKKDSP
ncbi:MAG: HDIG domain-containing protein [Candidatus Omnitrophica bacterium]|nr:HDIG domain-containing protein [Candidatus Omnitrophota bacterium]MBU4473275.1 HDIG domain-containing protein [Candidatus Omnitrophota bacterium]